MTVTYRPSRAPTKTRRSASKRPSSHGAATTRPPRSALTSPPTRNYYDEAQQGAEEPSPEFFTPAAPEPTPLYRFLEDWNRGIIPSNAAILNFLQTWEASPVLATDSRLSPAGLSLVRDIKELGAVLARVVAERNKDALLQRFVGHLRLAGRIIRTGPRSGRLTLVEDLPHRRRVKMFGRRDVQIRTELQSRRQTVQQDARELWQLAQLMISSADFRGVITSIQKLAWRAVNQCPVAGPIATATTQGLGLSPSTRENKVAVDPSLDPMSEAKLHADLDRTRRQLDELQQTTRPPSEPTDVPYVEIYEPRTRPLSQHTGEPGQQSQQQQQQQQQAPTGRDASVDALLDDVKALFIHIAANSDFRNSLQGIWIIFSRWQHEASQLPGTVLPSDLVYDANFAAAQQDLITLAERFANGASLRPLISSIASFQRETRSDYELNDFFLDWKAFLTACMNDPVYMDHDEFRRRGRFLLDRTNDYAVKKYRPLFQENLESWHTFLQGWQQDKLTNEISRIVSHIVNQDLFGGASNGGRGLLALGNIQTSLLADLRDVIFPSLLHALYELPIPHLEIEQGSMKVSLDNIVLPAALFAPADLNLQTRSSLHVTPRERFLSGLSRRRPRATGGWRSGAHLALTGMRGDIPNIQFAIDRQSFPRVRDAGTCDVRLGGRGLTIDVSMTTDINASLRRFHIEPTLVRVRIDKLALRFYEVHNHTLFSMARPYLQYTMKKRIESAICERVVEIVDFVDNLAGRLAKSSVSPIAS